MSSFTPEPGTPLAAYYAAIAPRVGTVLSRRRLGTLDATTISRYAMTIGAADPIHYDRPTARAAGYADVVAPPNLLAAVVEWGAGTPESDLQPDGTPADGDMPLGDGLGLRVMGAGEEMELVNPVTAGTDLVLETVARRGVTQGHAIRALRVRHHEPHLPVRRRRRAQPQPAHRRAARSDRGELMSTEFKVGALLPPLTHTVTPFQLFRYSAVTWNPHRIHFDAQHARDEGHAGLALHSHLRAALAATRRHRGARAGMAHRQRRVPPAPTALRAGRADLHRPCHRRRRRRCDPRAHRG